MNYACSYKEFKRRIADFTNVAPTLTNDQLDLLFEAIRLSYENMNDSQHVNSASIAFTIASGVYRRRKNEVQTEMRL